MIHPPGGGTRRADHVRIWSPVWVGQLGKMSHRRGMNPPAGRENPMNRVGIDWILCQTQPDSSGLLCPAGGFIPRRWCMTDRVRRQTTIIAVRSHARLRRSHRPGTRWTGVRF